MHTDAVEYEITDTDNNSEIVPVDFDGEPDPVKHSKEEKLDHLAGLVRAALIEERLEARKHENARALKSRVSSRRKQAKAVKASRKRNRG